MDSWAANRARASKETRKRIREFWTFRQELTGGRHSDRFGNSEDLKEDLDFENEIHGNLTRDLRQFEELPSEDVAEQVEPFSLQPERDSGEIDRTGALRPPAKDDVRDSWADELDSLPVKHRKPSDSPAAAPPPPEQPDVLKLQLHSLMNDGETVAQMVNRLRGGRKSLGNYKRNQRKGTVETRENSVGNETVSEEFSKAIEMISALIACGEVDVHDWKRSDLEHLWKARTGENLAGPYTSEQIRRMKSQGVTVEVLKVDKAGKTIEGETWQWLDELKAEEIV